MAVLNLNNIKKSYGFTEVLDGFSMSVYQGENLALIGPNGSGKSTIFKIINGQENFSEGNLSIRNDIKVGCLNQIPNFDPDKTLWSELKEVFQEIIEIKKEINKLEKLISNCGEDIRDNTQKTKSQQENNQIYLNNAKKSTNEGQLELLLKKYSDLREKFEEKNGYEYKSKINRVAIGLGFTHRELNKKVNTLSGGEKTRLGLVKLLLTEPDLLLLDEPTNHLDISSIQWLENYLSNIFAGSVIIISHDRYFLNEVVDRIIELKKGDSEIYHGNYSYYLKERKKRYEQRLKEYDNQQKKINQMEDAIERLRRWGSQGDNPKFFKRAKSMEKELEKMDKIDKPTLGGEKFNLNLNIDQRSGDEVLKINELYFSYNNNNNGENLLKGLDLNVYWQDKIGIVGDNGSGKTTLLKLIVNQFIPDQGQIEIGVSVKIGYYTQEFDNFNPEDEVLTAFRKEVPIKTSTARNVLATFLFTGDEVFKKVGNLSGGEKRRLRLLQLMQGNYNLLILDEPTNHLDLPAREVLEEALNNYPGTLIIVSHDRYFLNKTIDYIYELKDGTLSKYYGNYDHFRQKKQLENLNNSEENKTKKNKKKQKSDYFKLKQKTKEKRKKKRKINNLEDSIMEIEKKKKELEKDMTNSENLDDFQLLNQLKTEYERIDKKLENLYQKWENLI